MSPKNAIMCWGYSVRRPIQLSAAFLPLSVLFRDSMTAVNYGWTLSESEPWKAGSTTCTCASAYGRRDAPSPVGLCLVRDACRLRAKVFHAQRRSRHFVFGTQIKSQPTRTLYDIKCVAALLIRPRKVTQICIYVLLCETCY